MSQLALKVADSLGGSRWPDRKRQLDAMTEAYEEFGGVLAALHSARVRLLVPLMNAAFACGDAMLSRKYCRAMAAAMETVLGGCASEEHSNYLYRECELCDILIARSTPAIGKTFEKEKRAVAAKCYQERVICLGPDHPLTEKAKNPK